MNRKNIVGLFITLGIIVNIAFATQLGNAACIDCIDATIVKDLYKDSDSLASCELFSESIVTDRVFLSLHTSLSINVTVIITDNLSLINDLMASTYEWSSLGPGDEVEEFNHPSVHPYFDLAYHYSSVLLYHYESSDSLNLVFNLSELSFQTLPNGGWVYAYVIITSHDNPDYMVYHSAIGNFIFCEDAEEHLQTSNLYTFNSVQADYASPINASYFRNMEEPIDNEAICYKAELYIDEKIDSCIIMYNYNISKSGRSDFIFENYGRELNAVAYVKIYYYLNDQIFSYECPRFQLSIYQDRQYFLWIFLIAVLIMGLLYLFEKFHSRKTTRLLLKTYLTKTPEVHSYGVESAPIDIDLETIFSSVIRLKILGLLARSNDYTAKEEEILGINEQNQNAIRDELLILKDQGIIGKKGGGRGVKVYYKVSKDDSNHGKPLALLEAFKSLHNLGINPSHLFASADRVKILRALTRNPPIHDMKRLNLSTKSNVNLDALSGTFNLIESNSEGLMQLKNKNATAIIKKLFDLWPLIDSKDLLRKERIFKHSKSLAEPIWTGAGIENIDISEIFGSSIRVKILEVIVKEGGSASEESITNYIFHPNPFFPEKRPKTDELGKELKNLEGSGIISHTGIQYSISGNSERINSIRTLFNEFLKEDIIPSEFFTNPMRIAILRLLARESLSLGELQERLPEFRDRILSELRALKVL